MKTINNIDRLIKFDYEYCYNTLSAINIRVPFKCLYKPIEYHKYLSRYPLIHFIGIDQSNRLGKNIEVLYVDIPIL